VNLAKEVTASIDRSLRAIERRGIDTYDPFDVFGMESVQNLMDQRGPLGVTTRKLLYLGTRYWPIFLRRLLRTPKRAAPGGVAALTMAYVAEGGGDSLRKARRHLEWLLENSTKTASDIGWGFPYSWKNEGVILAPGMPIGHTTMTCGNAFLQYYHKTQDSWAIDPLLRSCVFLQNGLNKTEHSEQKVSVSYTPVDHSQVINVSADVGSLLMRTGSQFAKRDFLEFGGKLIRWVIKEQNADGSWYYNSYGSIGKESMIDHRHSAMVLSALSEVMPLCDTELAEPVGAALEKGLEYYLSNLFTGDGLPKFFHNRTYPLEIYNFAQGIITLLDITHVPVLNVSLLQKTDEMLRKLVSNTLSLMQKRDGSFLYMRERYWKTDLESLRWANALTTFALSRYLKSHVERVSKSDTASLVATAT
jgi:hypothetical protein